MLPNLSPSQPSCLSSTYRCCFQQNKKKLRKLFPVCPQRPSDPGVYSYVLSSGNDSSRCLLSMQAHCPRGSDREGGSLPTMLYISFPRLSPRLYHPTCTSALSCVSSSYADFGLEESSGSSRTSRPLYSLSEKRFGWAVVNPRHKHQEKSDALEMQLNQ